MGSPNNSTRRLRILIAEDNTVNQQVMVAILARAGHETSVANDGTEALALLDQGKAFDLVLMDVEMPHLDGLQTTRRIRERAGLAALPIVGLTAHAMSSDRARCLAAGMNDYLSKPVSAHELRATLAHWCP
jgi:CheY-like chemotaxis protein